MINYNRVTRVNWPKSHNARDFGRKTHNNMHKGEVDS